MTELFYIWIVIAQPGGGVEMIRRDVPYVTAQACVDATGKVLDEAKKATPMARGALCYTPSEFDGNRYDAR